MEYRLSGIDTSITRNYSSLLRDLDVGKLVMGARLVDAEAPELV